MTRDEMINMPSGELMNMLALAIAAGSASEDHIKQICAMPNVYQTILRSDVELIADGFELLSVQVVRRWVERAQ